jgi:hypothetical protein
MFVTGIRRDLGWGAVLGQKMTPSQAKLAYQTAATSWNNVKTWRARQSDPSLLSVFDDLQVQEFMVVYDIVDRDAAGVEQVASRIPSGDPEMDALYAEDIEEWVVQVRRLSQMISQVTGYQPTKLSVQTPSGSYVPSGSGSGSVPSAPGTTGAKSGAAASKFGGKELLLGGGLAVGLGVVLWSLMKS